MGVLVTLTGAAPGCGYDNPGFKLKDSDPVASSGAETTNIGGVTMTTTEPMTPTTSSTTESMTTQGPGVSGSETSASTGVDPTTSTTETTSTTGGVEYYFPKSCGVPIRTEFQDAAADTLFVYQTPQNGCTLKPELKIECRDFGFGAWKRLPMFFTNGGEGYTADYFSIVAVRFAAPEFVHVDEELKLALPITPDDFIGVEVKIQVFHQDPNVAWAGGTIDVLEFEEMASWEEGPGKDAEFAGCKSPGASFHCRKCKAVGVDCDVTWNGVDSPPFKVEALQTIKLPEVAPDANDGAELVVEDLTKDDLGWLMERGLMFTPSTDILSGMLEARARDAPTPGHRPGLRAVYCKPEPKP